MPFLQLAYFPKRMFQHFTKCIFTVHLLKKTETSINHHMMRRPTRPKFWCFKWFNLNFFSKSWKGKTFLHLMQNSFSSLRKQICKRVLIFFFILALFLQVVLCTFY